MPASVEVISPENVTLSGTNATGLVNDFIAKMHERDMVAKESNQTIRLLTQNINLLVENLVISALHYKASTVDELSKTTGVDKTKIPLFIEKLVKEDKVIENAGKYSLKQEC